MNDRLSLSRRDFLKISSMTGLGLVVSLYVPGCSRMQSISANTEVSPAPTLPPVTPTPEENILFAPNVFVTISTDGSVTLTCPRPDMGQGTRTALSMILAEELGADWSAVKIAQADADLAFGNQQAGGSTSVQDSYMPLRNAGALLRNMLIRAAAEKWETDPANCFAENGRVTNRDSLETLPFSELVKIAMTYDANDFFPVELKKPEDFKIIGTSLPRVDGPAMVTGRAVYGMDVRTPDMLYAVVARCPVFGGKLVSFDASEARSLPGVVDVVEIDSSMNRMRPNRSVAVLARNSWDAIKGRNALKITWDEGPNASLNSTDMEKKLLEQVTYPAADGELVSYYTVPFFSHSPMEPINSTVRAEEKQCEVWVGTQSPQELLGFVSNTFGVRPSDAHVHVPLVGGGFGRRLEFPAQNAPMPVFHLRESYELSLAMGVPVKVVWTREDDMHFEYYHPMSITRVAAQMDDISTIRFKRVEGQDFGIPTGAWRAVTNVPQAFALGSFVDEFAAATKQDPISLHRQLLNEREQAVLDLVVERSNWGGDMPPGHGRGIAIHSTWGVSPCAQVAEVRVEEDGQVRVLRVVCAIDCGVVINPDMVKAQMEGGILFGLTSTLKAQITVANGRVEQSNFHNYPVLRMDETPEIEVFVVKSGADPTGTGEMANPPIAPAVANAIFAATGKRIRRLPLRGENLAA